jgi:cytosine/adenosine deaminase-related metal-dependent hydrolase
VSTATRIVIAWLTVILLALHVVAQQTGEQSASKIIAVRAGHLIDGQGGPTAVDVVILVDGERIVAVRPNVAIPTGARVIDLSKSTVLAGLIDCHTHPFRTWCQRRPVSAQFCGRGHSCSQARPSYSRSGVHHYSRSWRAAVCRREPAQRDRAQ